MMVYSISNDDHETLVDEVSQYELRAYLQDLREDHSLHRLTVTGWDHSRRAPNGGPELIGQVNGEEAARSLSEQGTVRLA